jgi:kynureninase
MSSSLAEKAAALDAADVLGAVRDKFERVEGWVYLDANSVGPAPKAARAAAVALVDDWVHLRRRGWAERDWVDMASIIGDAIAPMIGAGPGEVVACDNTTVNLYKATGHALAVQEGRTVLLTQGHNFPTDLHVLQGYVRASAGRLSLRTVTTEEEAIAAMDEDVALASFSLVDYKSGDRWDMGKVNAAAREKGVLTLWDASHAAGAVPVDASGTGADYVIVCGYKYLCVGPGGPAFIYVRPGLADLAWPPLCGWMGHRDIYAFSGEYVPHQGVKRFISGTPLVGANELAATAADIYRTVKPQDLWAKHRSLSEFLIEALEAECGALGVEVTSPREYDKRGGQVSFRAPGAGHVVEALIDAKVVSSFRKPDSIRFGLSPLALTHGDMLTAVARLKTILETEIWRDPKYADVSV